MTEEDKLELFEGFHDLCMKRIEDFAVRIKAAYHTCLEKGCDLYQADGGLFSDMSSVLSDFSSEKSLDNDEASVFLSYVEDAYKDYFVREISGNEEINSVDEFLLGGDSFVLNHSLGFDRACHFLSDTLMKLSHEIGWKNDIVPYDFDGFSGYYPKVNDDSAEIWKGDEMVARFTSDADGHLVFEPFSAEFSAYDKDVNPWYPLADIMNGKFCLDEQNIAKARLECHNGMQVIYGMRFGDACAFGIYPKDDNLRTLLAERELNVRFTEPSSFWDAMNAWTDKVLKPGFESDVRPELVLYAYDGKDLHSERELSFGLERKDQIVWEGDWKLIDELRSRGDEVRSELERAAGIEDNERHFRFGQAYVPTVFLRNDALFITNRYGISSGDFITAVNGRIALYREKDYADGLSVPVRVFKDVDEAVGAVRTVCLSEKNIGLARSEYESYKQGLSKAFTPKMN